MMKLDFNKEMGTWLSTLNNNAKWSVAFIIRFIAVFTFLILFIFILKWTGVFKGIKGIFITEEIEIEQKDFEYESKPSTPTHKTEIERIEELEKLIKDKIKK